MSDGSKKPLLLQLAIFRMLIGTPLISLAAVVKLMDSGTYGLLSQSTQVLLVFHAAGYIAFCAFSGLKLYKGNTHSHLKSAIYAMWGAYLFDITLGVLLSPGLHPEFKNEVVKGAFSGAFISGFFHLYFRLSARVNALFPVPARASSQSAPATRPAPAPTPAPAPAAAAASSMDNRVQVSAPAVEKSAVATLEFPELELTAEEAQAMGAEVAARQSAAAVAPQIAPQMGHALPAANDLPATGATPPIEGGEPKASSAFPQRAGPDVGKLVRSREYSHSNHRTLANLDALYSPPPFYKTNRGGFAIALLVLLVLLSLSTMLSSPETASPTGVPASNLAATPRPVGGAVEAPAREFPPVPNINDVIAQAARKELPLLNSAVVDVYQVPSWLGEHVGAALETQNTWQAHDGTVFMHLLNVTDKDINGIGARYFKDANRQGAYHDIGWRFSQALKPGQRVVLALPSNIPIEVKDALDIMNAF